MATLALPSKPQAPTSPHGQQQGVGRTLSPGGQCLRQFITHQPLLCEGSCQAGRPEWRAVGAWEGEGSPHLPGRWSPGSRGWALRGLRMSLSLGSSSVSLCGVEFRSEQRFACETRGSGCQISSRMPESGVWKRGWARRVNLGGVCVAYQGSLKLL